MESIYVNSYPRRSSSLHPITTKARPIVKSPWAGSQGVTQAPGAGIVNTPQGLI
jgi:hypothetical protein